MRGPSLGIQLASAMVACVVVTVVIAVAAALGLMMVEDGRLEASLSPRASAARAALIQNRIPSDTAAFQELLDAQARNRGRQGEIDRTALVGVALAAATLGGLIAALTAGRLSRQLTLVSEAAGRVAAGDLTARANIPRGSSGEPLILAENFNRMAEALEGFERRFIESSAAIAHELRTPLAILRGRLQGIDEGMFPAGRGEMAGLIGHVDSLGRIVNDLLLVSLGSAGRLDVVLTDVDLGQLIQVLMMEVTADLECEGLEVELDLQPAPVRADPDRVRQAVIALIENVRRHAVEGGSIRIETGKTGGFARLSVLDRGATIPVQHRERVFEPFWQKLDQGPHSTGGHGLGLSVVSSIAKAHGGEVRLEARPSGGSAFHLLFPSRIT